MEKKFTPLNSEELEATELKFPTDKEIEKAIFAQDEEEPWAEKDSPAI